MDARQLEEKKSKRGKSRESALVEGWEKEKEGLGAERCTEFFTRICRRTPYFVRPSSAPFHEKNKTC
jgi:hypothetical protein